MTDRDLDCLLRSLREELAARPSEAFAARVRADLVRRRSAGRRRQTAVGVLAGVAAAVLIWPAGSSHLPDVPAAWGSHGPLLPSPRPAVDVLVTSEPIVARAPVRVSADVSGAVDDRADLRAGVFDAFVRAAAVEVPAVWVEQAAPVATWEPRPLFEPVQFPAVDIPTATFTRVEIPDSNQPGTPVVRMMPDGKGFR